MRTADQLPPIDEELEKRLDSVCNFVMSVEWKLICEFYGERTAKRSGVPLINHISEGIGIINELDGSVNAMKAFAIHPMVQADGDLQNNIDGLLKAHVDTYVLVLAMEYRNIANQYLSFRNINDISEINLSPVKDVNDMLIADKIQNYKDFIIYHKGTHPRSDELDQYFRNWLSRLEANELFEKHTGFKL